MRPRSADLYHEMIESGVIKLDGRFDHLVIEVVALTGALADAGEHRHTAVRLGDVVDQLHDHHGLADAGAAEQADLAALGVGCEQVDDLDAGGQDLRFRRLIDELRRAAMDRQGLLVADWTALVDRLADDVQDAAECLGADRHGDRAACVDRFLAAHQAVGGVHGDGADLRLTQMLGDLEHDQAIVGLHMERVQDVRQVGIEAHVDDRARDLGDRADIVGGHEMDPFLRLRGSRPRWPRRPR
jgi:peptide chain release factor 1